MAAGAAFPSSKHEGWLQFTGDKGPTSVRPLLSEPRGSVQIETDRNIHVIDSFSAEDENNQPEFSTAAKAGGAAASGVSPVLL